MRRTAERPGLLARGVLALVGAVVVACASAEPDYSVQAPPASTGQGGTQPSGASGGAGSASAGKGGEASGGSSGQGGAAAGKGGAASGAGTAGAGSSGGGSGPSGASGQVDAFGGSGGTGSQAGASSQGGAASSAGASAGGAPGGSAGQGGASPSGSSGQAGEPPDGALVIGEQVETTTQLIVQQQADPIVRVVASGTTPCKLSGSPFFTKTTYAYAQVYNPNAQPARVELGVGAVTGQTPPNLPIMAAYGSLPSTDDERIACLSGAEMACPDNPSLLACLGDQQAPTVPAHGSVWVYVGNFAADDPAVSFVLYARLLALL